jgi:hypothetical protein
VLLAQVIRVYIELIILLAQLIMAVVILMAPQEYYMAPLGMITLNLELAMIILFLVKL